MLPKAGNQLASPTLLPLPACLMPALMANALADSAPAARTSASTSAVRHGLYLRLSVRPLAAVGARLLLSLLLLMLLQGLPRQGAVTAMRATMFS